MKLNSNLRLARRSLEEIKDVEILQDWQWQKSKRMWRLDLRLSSHNLTPSNFVPKTTDWCVFVSPHYPWGDIDFFPYKENGLTVTFQHQNYNWEAKDESEWRAGKICLETPVHSLGRYFVDNEPFSAGKRLLWYVKRALQWLVLASNDKLTEVGDPYEMPYIPTISKEEKVLFAETSTSMKQWEDFSLNRGEVTFYEGKGNRELLIVKNYKGFGTESINSNRWGRYLIQKEENTKTGIWITIPSLPILKPWQIPVTWGELRQALHNQRINLNDFLFEQFKSNRLTGFEVLIMGFPIPEVTGEKPVRYQWLALRFPKLHTANEPVPGFRKNPKKSWTYNLARNLSDNSPLKWLETENWAADQLNNRGKMNKQLRSKKIALIGAGAIGSTVGELLARGGCNEITIFDADVLKAGNLIRHTLTLSDVEKYKAESMSGRLNQISPFAKTNYYNESLPVSNSNAINALKKAEIIIDCSGEDEVLCELKSFEWNSEKTFFSVSIGSAAQRLFLFSCYGKTFNEEDFRKKISPWLHKEQSENTNYEDFPREGIGCWHPVFPARADDIWLMSSVAIKIIEEILFKEELSNSQLRVYKQTRDGNLFLGLEKESLNE